MNTVIMEGNTPAQNKLHYAKKRVEWLKDECHTVVLAVISVGDHQANQVYINNKRKACKEVGVAFLEISLAADCTQEQLEETILDANNSDMVSGIILQLPIPEHLNAAEAIQLIDPSKDVDGLHPLNIGRLTCGDTDHSFTPCTAMGIIDLLQFYHIDPQGKHVVIVGRSKLVGLPLAQLMLQSNATVTVCHSKTTDLASYTSSADILISAAGKPRLITADMVKDGAVVIDVGINRVDGKLCGDVDFESVKEKASFITPVPGGVGKMTVAELICNTVLAEERIA